MPHRPALLALALFACTDDPPDGSNIGALREPDPEPVLPSDTTTLDIASAIEEAMLLGGVASLAAAWDGHALSLDQAAASCPTVWIGPLPEDLVDVDINDDVPGFSWAANCAVPGSGASWEGFAHWSSVITEPEGARDLVASAVVTAANGQVLYAFDGAAADAYDASTGQYASVIEGELSGSLVGLGSGLRTGAELNVAWGGGGVAMLGSLTMLDGFGPPDNRDPADSPELEDVEFTPGMPRFTSVVYDLEINADCPDEPIGYIGLRGHEGVWFDVYFLPKYDPVEDPSLAGAYPYEDIDNLACDGRGTLFARNVSLAELDEADPAWSREVAPDFASVLASLPTPNLDAYVYTLRNLPLE